MKIVWVKSSPLHPLDTGGKIRTYQMLRQLKRQHELTYVSLCPESCEQGVLDAAAEYSSRQVWVPWCERCKGSAAFYLELAANLFSDLPYVIAKYRSPRMADEIRALEAYQQPDLFVCDFLTPAVNLFAGVPPQTRTLLFQHNVESLIWKRLYENTSGVRRVYFREQWRRMERFERDACAQCDGVVAVSEVDCNRMRNELGLGNVLGHVPTGVDLAYYCPTTVLRKSQALVFLGSMDWMPNVDAVCYFAEEILPLIRRQFPETTLTIAGRNPTPHVQRLAQRFTGVRVTGTVADVRPYLAEAELMIVPLRVGGGTRIKIYEAMATGIPVVSSRVGAEGLSVTHGEDILLADSPADFAKCVGELFQRPEWRAHISSGGLATVREQCSWESIAEQFAGFCRAVCANREKPS